VCLIAQLFEFGSLLSGLVSVVGILDVPERVGPLTEKAQGSSNHDQTGGQTFEFFDRLKCPLFVQMFGTIIPDNQIHGLGFEELIRIQDVIGDDSKLFLS